MNHKLSVTPTKKELLWGSIYMVLEMFVLSSLLYLVNALLHNPLPDSILNCIYFAVNFLFVALIFRKFLLKTFSQPISKIPRILTSSILAYVLYWVGLTIVGIIIFNVDPEYNNVNDTNIADLVYENFWPMAFCTVGLVPITEELLFRGVLFAGIYNRRPILAVLVSTVVFCIIHVMGYIGLYPPQTLFLCLLQYVPAGLALCFAYIRADSILAPVLMHMFINATGILAMR